MLCYAACEHLCIRFLSVSGLEIRDSRYLQDVHESRQDPVSAPIKNTPRGQVERLEVCIHENVRN